MKQKLYLILLAILILSIVLILLSTSLHFFSGGNVPLDYGIAIDAGSSKTKFFLYDWSSSKTNQTGFVKEIATEKVKISIDEYANDLTNLIKPLMKTLNQISTKIEYTRNQYTIPIYLGATAGMRLLKAVNAQDSDKILKEIKVNFEQFTLSQKRFKVENVEIISGEKEGLYCWIATNYLMNYIPPSERKSDGKSIGILDMGGASAQIAFQTHCTTEGGCKSENTNLVATEKTKLFGTPYDVYTYSNLCFGNDEARRRYHYVVIFKSNQKNEIVDDPCTHPGQLDRNITKEQILEDVCTNNNKVKESLKYDSYKFRAIPNIQKCEEYTKLLVDKVFVGNHFVSSGEEISFKIMEEPPPDYNFYALSTYYYTTSQLKKNKTINFEDEDELKREINKFCSKKWSDIVKESGGGEIEYLHNYCFALNYMFNNLKYVYKFSGKQFNKIEFRDKLNGHDLGWSLGYMLQATNSIPNGGPEEPILNTSQFVILSIFGLILFIAAILIFLKKYNQKVFTEQYELEL